LKRLCEELISRGFHMIDCQMSTPHLMSLGARMIPRGEFTQVLDEHMYGPFEPKHWIEAGNESPLVNV
jgi:leucyl/phenylalanyl-tRNA--protein transferase